MSSLNRRMEGQEGSGRRRVYWGQQGGFYPPFSLTHQADTRPAYRGGGSGFIGADNDAPPTMETSLAGMSKGLIYGIGVGFGLLVVHKIAKKRR